MFMYLSGMAVFLFSFNHFLFVLLSLEFMMLAIFLFLFFLLSMMMINLFFSMIYLTMVVCEGVLGLSIMVSVIRFSGNDNLMSLSSLW
uniref:NADH-ubiquinone oxidoreductase chain 4L n=1 Tax=Cassida sp. EMHAU-15090501 TaxID=2480058 RepID=A0A3G3C779_9CUCU|nr:NADH dehydrogenase subunit 4L [Cassida sp. EMHAU-15090501]